jgi:hypothetical protein
MLQFLLGLWALVAGISLTFTFFRQYRGRTRYLYLLLFGLAAGLWGAGAVFARPLAPGWLILLLLTLGLISMLRDSARRYRERFEETIEERRRLRDDRIHPPDGGEGG